MMDTILNSMTQMFPVIATILSGIWYLSTKFSGVEKKCDLIDQKVDHMSEKITVLNEQQNVIQHDFNSLDRRVLVLELETKSNKEQESA